MLGELDRAGGRVVEHRGCDPAGEIRLASHRGSPVLPSLGAQRPARQPPMHQDVG